jgi:hypothetical protein
LSELTPIRKQKIHTHRARVGASLRPGGSHD